MVSGPCLVSIPTVQQLSVFIGLLRKEREKTRRKMHRPKKKKNKNNARQAAVTMPSL